MPAISKAFRVRSRQLIFSKKIEKLLFSRALKARASHTMNGTNALLKHEKKVASRFFWKKFGVVIPLGYDHATRKAAFFRHVKLRSSRVSISNRELRSFTCLKKAAFFVAWTHPNEVPLTRKSAMEFYG